MKRIFLLLIGLNAFLSLSQTFGIDTDSARVEFEFIDDGTRGTLTGVEAELNLNLAEISKSSVVGQVDVESLNTGNSARDKHLKSNDFFETETYPTMFFTGDTFEKRGDKYYVRGTLKIRNVTKDEEFEIVLTEHSIEFVTSINAMDYGVSPRKGKEKSMVNIKVVFVK